MSTHSRLMRNGRKKSYCFTRHRETKQERLPAGSLSLSEEHGNSLFSTAHQNKPQSFWNHVLGAGKINGVWSQHTHQHKRLIPAGFTSQFSWAAAWLSHLIWRPSLSHEKQNDWQTKWCQTPTWWAAAVPAFSSSEADLLHTRAAGQPVFQLLAANWNYSQQQPGQICTFQSWYMRNASRFIHAPVYTN